MTCRLAQPGCCSPEAGALERALGVPLDVDLRAFEGRAPRRVARVAAGRRVGGDGEPERALPARAGDAHREDAPLPAPVAQRERAMSQRNDGLIHVMRWKEKGAAKQPASSATSAMASLYAWYITTEVAS